MIIPRGFGSMDDRWPDESAARRGVGGAGTSLRGARIIAYYIFRSGDSSHAGRSRRARMRASAENQSAACISLEESFRNGSNRPNVKDEPRHYLARHVRKHGA